MKPVALELCPTLTPRALLRLTPGETYEMIEAAISREKRSDRRAAWVVSWLMKPHLKKGANLTPAMLLGEPEPVGEYGDERDFGWGAAVSG